MKSTIFIILLFIMGMNSEAQRVQFKISSGYAFPTFKQSVEGYYDVILDGSQLYKTEINNPFSLGSGWNINTGLQFNPSDHFGFGLDVNYLHGSKIRFTQQDAISTVISNNEQDLFGRSTRIIPHITIKGDEGNVQPYLSLGYILAFSNVFMHEENTIGSALIIRDWEYSADLSQGMNFVAGLFYHLDDSKALFLEANYQKINYKPTTLSMVSATENGQNILQSYQVIEREISYTSHIDLEYNASPDPKKPQLLHEIYFPYASLMLNFGIIFNLQ